MRKFLAVKNLGEGERLMGFWLILTDVKMEKRGGPGATRLSVNLMGASFGVARWVSIPVVLAMMGRDGKKRTRSVVNTVDNEKYI